MKTAAPAPGAEPVSQPKKKRSVSAILVGLLTVGFAAYGVFSLVMLGVNTFREGKKAQEDAFLAAYYQYLIPAAAIDLEPFDDVTGAKMSELVEMSVWSLLYSGLDPATTRTQNDELFLAASSLEASYHRFFGTERPIEHGSVQGYGYAFTYDPSLNCYRIPLSTITPIYTPVILSSETRGSSVVLEVGYLRTDMYTQDRVTGVLTLPDPDRIVRVTLRTVSTGTYISSLRSDAAPETAQ